MTAQSSRLLLKKISSAPWAGGLWRQALRKLPGAQAWRRVVFDGKRCRATFVPAAVIDTYVPRPETGGNVVPLHP